MEQRCLNRINELAKIAKERELTPEEKAERTVLRQNYLKAFRAAFSKQLENTVVQYPDGHKESLREVGKRHGK